MKCIHTQGIKDNTCENCEIYKTCELVKMSKSLNYCIKNKVIIDNKLSRIQDLLLNIKLSIDLSDFKTDILIDDLFNHASTKNKENIDAILLMLEHIRVNLIFYDCNLEKAIEEAKKEI